MIAFATLFLGLVFGPKPVEVIVGPEVAAVEVYLDGESVGKTTGEPWTLPVDFGSELAPRFLEAVALDAQGQELDRIHQWINLPRPRVAMNVVLEEGGPGGSRVARLSWESAAGAEPEKVVATLDGEPLTVTDPRRIALPVVDENQFHLLQIEMFFEGWVSSRLDLTFGGAYSEEVSTEMTALPLVSTGKSRRAPTAETARDWFSKDGEKLRVIALEKETAEVVVVMDRPFPHFVAPGRPYKGPKALKLPSDLELRFLATRPKTTPGVQTTFELFPISTAYGGDVGDLYEMLTRILRTAEDSRPRPAAAVAVAGLAAYDGRHRRAVVLIPDTGRAGEDKVSPAQVRRYLERLRVPVVVWDPEVRSPDALAEAWGEVYSVGSLDGLSDAFEELKEELGRQWIVWLDGHHLPQEIELSPEARGAGFEFPR